MNRPFVGGIMQFAMELIIISAVILPKVYAIIILKDPGRIGHITFYKNRSSSQNQSRSLAVKYQVKNGKVTTCDAQETAV